jgi:hypothetical protein
MMPVVVVRDQSFGVEKQGIPSHEESFLLASSDQLQNLVAFYEIKCVRFSECLCHCRLVLAVSQLSVKFHRLLLPQ